LARLLRPAAHIGEYTRVSRLSPCFSDCFKAFHQGAGGAAFRGVTGRARGLLNRPVKGETTMLFRQLFDPESSTYTYLIADQASREAAIVDPVLEQVERDATLIRELGLHLRY